MSIRYLVVISTLALLTSSVSFTSKSLAADEPGEERVSQIRKLGIAIPPPAPERPDGEGRGPFEKLVISNVMLIDGRGSPVRGPCVSIARARCR